MPILRCPEAEPNMNEWIDGKEIKFELMRSSHWEIILWIRMRWNIIFSILYSSKLNESNTLLWVARLLFIHSCTSANEIYELESNEDGRVDFSLGSRSRNDEYCAWASNVPTESTSFHKLRICLAFPPVDYLITRMQLSELVAKFRNKLKMVNLSSCKWKVMEITT